MRTNLGPDFFIVGAPKCGTTSLNGYLAEHPAIFMAKKEQHFFGSDLADTWPQPSREKYFDSFAGSDWATRRGESSGWYLWSRAAPHEIHAYKPDSQLIALLRNPVEMLPSLHSQYLHDEMEDLADFGAAFAAEDDRRLGRRIPPNNGRVPWRLFYREVVAFGEQLERYFTVFGREQVHVVLFDDLVADVSTTYRDVLRFLGVDSAFEASFRVLNPNKRTRSRFVKRGIDRLRDTSSLPRRVGTRLIPSHAVRSAMLRYAVSSGIRLNTSYAARPPLDVNLRHRLAVELRPQIEHLEEVVDRDLSHWISATPTIDHSAVEHPA